MKFESWFDEMRTNREFRREYERYYQSARAAGVKAENPKTWAYDCFLAVEEEKVARASVARVLAREARATRGRVLEVTSAIVKYEDYPT